MYPRIYLAIDNCFASKRYTEPEDWLKLMRDLGIHYIEANADTECDPLIMGKDYIGRWIRKVKNASEKLGVSICNLHSGHGTYSTLGLAHTDPEVRSRILNEWIKPMIECAAALDAGLGIFCHAFSNPVLQNPDLYQEYRNELIKNLCEITEFSHEVKCKSVSLEQMYSPHQYPWTIKGAKELMNEVYEKTIKPLYITIDTGHQSGQRNYLKIQKDALVQAMEHVKKEGEINHLWLGPDSAYELFESCKSVDKSKLEGLAKNIFDEMERFPFLFCETNDASTYKWLEELACYSPIIHLQQTDGNSSSHWPFSKFYNKRGIIEGKKVLEAVKNSYENKGDLNIHKAEKIFMTIEAFASTGSINYDTINELKESVRYWRQFIPEDGIKVDVLI